jgi:release factor glutamine methyltransferase
MTINQALIQAAKKLQSKNISSAHLDAEVLLGYILKKSREHLLAHDENRLKSTEQKKYSTLVSRRARYEPIAYLIGQKEFYGLNLIINKSVLIPRPETELLVEETIKIASRLNGKNAKLTILDTGTGSGAIALSLKTALPQARILALEASAAALKLARLNAKKHRLKIELIKSDLLAAPAVKRVRSQIIAANLPYLDHSELAGFPIEIRRGLSYEPTTALFAGQSGTSLYEKLFKQINALPFKPKFIVIEIGSWRHKKFLALANKYFVQAKIEVKNDLAGRPRLLIIKL